MQTVRYDLTFYVNLLESRVPFAFSRWGDGEWYALLGYAGQNCDGHQYFPEMGAELRRIVLTDRPYFYALGPKARSQLGEQIDAFLTEHGIDRVWHSTEVFLEAGLAGRLRPLVQSLRRSRLVYVAPIHLGAFVTESLGAVAHVPVPSQNCYLQKRAIRQVIDDVIAQYCPTVVGFSCGMLANILIDDLFERHGDNLTLIDFGSVFDPYVGRISRKYMQSVDWTKRYRENFLFYQEAR